MKPGRFRHTVAWVTGASSGIGRALALELDRQGAEVILSGRDVQRLETVRLACGHPDDVNVLPFDLSDLEALPAVAASMTGTSGSPSASPGSFRPTSQSTH